MRVRQLCSREEAAALAEVARLIVLEPSSPPRQLQPPMEYMDEEGPSRPQQDPRRRAPEEPRRDPDGQQGLGVIHVLKRQTAHESSRSIEEFYIRGGASSSGASASPEDGSSPGIGPSPASPGATTTTRHTFKSTTVIEEESLGYPEIPLTGRVVAPLEPGAQQGDDHTTPAEEQEGAADEAGDEHAPPAGAEELEAAPAALQPVEEGGDEHAPPAGAEELEAAPALQPVEEGVDEHALPAGAEELEAEQPAADEGGDEHTPPAGDKAEPAGEDIQILGVAEVKKEVEVITIESSSSDASSSSHRSKRKHEPGAELARRPKRIKRAPTRDEFAQLQATVRGLQEQLARHEETSVPVPARTPVRVILDFPEEPSHVKYNKIEAALPLNSNEEFAQILADEDGPRALDMILDNLIVEEITSETDEDKKKKSPLWWLGKPIHAIFSNEYMENNKVYDSRANYKQKAGTAMTEEIYLWLEKSITSTIESQGLSEEFPWKRIINKLRDIFRYTRCNVRVRREEKEQREKKKQREEQE